MKLLMELGRSLLRLTLGFRIRPGAGHRGTTELGRVNSLPVPRGQTGGVGSCTD